MVSALYPPISPFTSHLRVATKLWIDEAASCLHAMRLCISIRVCLCWCCCRRHLFDNRCFKINLLCLFAFNIEFIEYFSCIRLRFACIYIYIYTYIYMCIYVCCFCSSDKAARTKTKRKPHNQMQRPRIRATDPVTLGISPKKVGHWSTGAGA